MIPDESPREKTRRDDAASRQGMYFDLGVLCLLGAIAIATRLLPHAPGFVAVTGAALFAGWYVRRSSLALLFPICVLLISDTVIGFYDPAVMAAVYACAVLTMMIGRSAHRQPRFVRMTCLLLACSVLNFLLINLLVWHSSGWYDRSFAGLLHCYTAALPFFKYRLAGDVCWTAVFFAPHILASVAARLRGMYPGVAIGQTCMQPDGDRSAAWQS